MVIKSARAASVVHGEHQAGHLSWARATRVLAEDDRGRRASRRQSDHAVIVALREVGVEPPAEFW